MEDKTRDAHLSRTWTHNTSTSKPLSIWSSSWSMSSKKISHFLLCPIPAWGKNLSHHSSLCSLKDINFDMSNRTRQALLYPCDATGAWTRNHYSDLNSCFATTLQNQNRSITSVSWRAFGKLKIEGSSTSQVYVYDFHNHCFILICPELKGSFLHPTSWRASIWWTRWKYSPIHTLLHTKLSTRPSQLLVP